MEKSDKHPFFGIWCDIALWTHYVSDEFYSIWTELVNVHGWKLVADYKIDNRTRLPDDTLNSYFNRYFNRMPDLILYVETYDTIYLHSRLADWRSIQHKWLFIDDLQTFYNDQAKLKKIAMMEVEHTVSTYVYKIDEHYAVENKSGLSEWSTFHRTWLPHSASPSFIVPYNRTPLMKIFMSGAVNEFYPYRGKAVDLYYKHPPGSPNNIIEYQSHPGYDPLTNITRSSARNAYARRINRYFAAITSSSIKNYIIAKIFEIPVAGALLILNSEAVPILDRLKWYENVHYITYNKTNMEDVFLDVLSNKSFEKYEKIRRTGHETALELHTTKRRALFLHNLAMNSYLNG